VRKRIADGSLEATKMRYSDSPIGWRWEVDEESVTANSGRWRGRRRYQRDEPYSPVDTLPLPQPLRSVSELRVRESPDDHEPRPHRVNRARSRRRRRRSTQDDAFVLDGLSVVGSLLRRILSARARPNQARQEQVVVVDPQLDPSTLQWRK
jgi:hypothetical protein